jgi:hypothetical protein
MLRGRFEEAGKTLSGCSESHGLRGWLSFIRGDRPGSLPLFAEDLARIRKINNNPEAYFTGLEGLFYLLALLNENRFAHYETCRGIITSIQKIQPHNIFIRSYTLLLAVIEANENNILAARGRIVAETNRSDQDSITSLFLALVNFWLEGTVPAKTVAHLKKLLQLAAKSGFHWLAHEYATILTASDSGPTTDLTQGIPDDPGFISVISSVRTEEQWQRALRALHHASQQTQPEKKRTVKERLAWMIRYEPNRNDIAVSPKAQSLNVRGQWTKGRPISLRKLYAAGKPAFLTEQDHQACAAITRTKDSRGSHYALDPDEAMAALIGHKSVFLEESPRIPVEILEGFPELMVDQHDGQLTVQILPHLEERQLMVVKETPTRFRVYRFNAEHRRIAGIIGPEGLQIPSSGREELFGTLGNISSFMTVHSKIDGFSRSIEEVNPDSTIYLHLIPYGTGFRVSMLVRPLRGDSSYHKPAEGPRIIMANADGRKLQTKRKLELEATQALEVEKACPMLGAAPSIDREWIFQEPEECLQLLLELQQLPEDVLVEWPEGERLTVSPPAVLDQFHLSIRKKSNWFEMSGQLQLDESLVLDMQKLLEISKKTSSRFIPLGQGHFLTLSNELRKKLDEINTYADLRNKGIRIHPLRAFAVSGLFDDLPQISTDTHWQMQAQRLQSARALDPQIPGTLQANLRDYQLDGYKWLTRLAHWGVGACLADDMGLGKTVQALAIMLARASLGPTLVVAPTSVCLNWQDEASRFAPTLTTHIFGGKQRQEMINGLKSFDVLICSYGLLQQEEKLLTETPWKTVILDEAQAIKNFVTKRSRAAMKLQGEFKVITSGTPIENHLPELWNLFNFINPGLLGSLTQFNERFAIPIERQNDPEARRRLKKLIRPFILRRIKSQVLEELPERTEIALNVEMNRKEAALYEAIRQEAVKKLSNPFNPGHKPLQVLAEIMKLRRCCCNPRLIVPDSTIPSSKLELFGKIISELLENRHKALVFSQFVDHLTLIREYLDGEKISYQYIDGSTPPRKRQERVKAFQAGEGDLFLISLKAGGMGLNLTAADYVIHMDPWWNPAVEDQASDRAHRIGQLHPVTIYRLVVRNTIEEKIMRLHREKRDLADTLLEGTDLSSRVTAQDLMTLLQDTV